MTRSGSNCDSPNSHHAGGFVKLQGLRSAYQFGCIGLLIRQRRAVDVADTGAGLEFGWPAAVDRLGASTDAANLRPVHALGDSGLFDWCRRPLAALDPGERFELHRIVGMLGAH